MVAGELVAPLMMVTLPVTLPAEVGANATLNEVDWPTERVSGIERPDIVKPLPVTLSPETETLPLPVLVRVTVCVALLPVRTLPKLRETGEADS